MTAGSKNVRSPETSVQGPEAIEKRLSLGLDIFMDFNPDGNQPLRYKARLCGWMTGRYLVLEPTSPLDPELVQKNQPCAVRFFVDGDVWGFGATVLDPGASSEHHLVQLRWPAQANRIRVREHDRMPLSVPCQIHGGGDAGIPAILDDLSLGGCSIRSSHVFALQTSIQVSFQLPGCGATELQQAVIRNIRKGNDRTILYGCQFVTLKNANDIAEYIRNRETRGGSYQRPQILVLTAAASDSQAVQTAVSNNAYEIVVVRNLLELGFRLWTGQPAAIMLSHAQHQLPPLEMCRLIKASPGISDVPLVVYGGSAKFHEQAFETGADLCLNSLEDAALITAFLNVEHLGQAQSPDY